MESYDRLKEYYFKSRHYCDEYKAIQCKESYYRFAGLMDRTFDMLFERDYETGEVVPPTTYTQEQYQKMYEDLCQAEQNIKYDHDPSDDRILLWNGSNMPWHLLSAQEWKENNQDGEEFVPHMVPFLQNDGKKHPSVLITGGNYRCHFIEGYPTAELYLKQGYNVFILNNRHALGSRIRQSLIRALDLQRAVRLLRRKKDELGVDPDRIFSNGFSMGNRASIDFINRLGFDTAPESIDPEYIPDRVDEYSGKLNAYVAVYPATFPYDNHSDYQNFPPSFFVFGNKDFSLWRIMPFVSDLLEHDVRAEVHIFEGVEHGFGIADGQFGDLACSEGVETIHEWPHLMFAWLKKVLA